MKDKLYIGIDIGSVSINIVVLDVSVNKEGVHPSPKILEERYVRIEGNPLKKAYQELKDVIKKQEASLSANEEKREIYMAATGSGGKLLAEILGIPFVNEVIAQAQATWQMYPEVRSIIEIGGEDSKFISIERKNEMHSISDFAMNTLCAAGTGSFLDQQASRLGLNIEEFSELGLGSSNPPRIAGRCSVFANTDMIHLQQEGTPVQDIVAGLCFALARNFKSVIAKGKKFTPPVSFQGGIAYNLGMRRAFKELLGLKDSEFIIPQYFASMGAIGAILLGMQNAKCKMQNADLEKILEFLDKDTENRNALKPLIQGTGCRVQGASDKSQALIPDSRFPIHDSRIPVWMGIDVGSISTNVVLIDKDKKLVARRYLWTQGKPIDAVLRGIREIGEEMGVKDSEVAEGTGAGAEGTNAVAEGTGGGAGVTGGGAGVISGGAGVISGGAGVISGGAGVISGGAEGTGGGAGGTGEVGIRVEVQGVGVTGSGRYMIGDLVGADFVKNEITSQAKASAEIDPDVDTIFEIGGQDSKYISLQNGVICDFEMNKVCAAGTGSFLEEQAERLNLNIKEEFGECALKSQSPIGLGDRCTVFMQSSLTNWQQKGALREDLAAGLAYSIAQNYLNKVVAGKKIGNNIFFQGAVAFNKAIVAAFQEILGREIKVPPNNDVTGAIGVAILTMQTKTENRTPKTKFKGFNLGERDYDIERFECDGCPNHCEIKKVLLEGEEPLYYGSRCEKYEKKREARSKKREADLFGVREALLLKSLKSQVSSLKSQVSIGIPRALIFYEYLPFWTTFFMELGYKVVLSDSTNKSIIHQGVEATVSDHCFPIKACHGHILNLIEKGVDYIFLPSVISMQEEYSQVQESYACPFVQAIPYLIKSAIDLKGVKLISPVLYLKRGKKWLENALIRVGNSLGKRKNDVIRAIDLANKSQDNFYANIKKKGTKILDRDIDSSKPSIVLVGRPYNTCDRGLNLDIPKILSDLGIRVIPMDFLPIENVEVGKKWQNMYWKYGQRILASAEIIKHQENLYPLYITNFGCGADSFIIKHFKEEIGDKPHLIIEVDEHSAPAGVITRCEAFLDSIQNTEVRSQKSEVRSQRSEIQDSQGRTLLIPFMGDHSEVIAAAFRHCDIPARVMPPTDSEALELGRKHTTGKECFPYILTTGDMIKVLNDPDTEREKIAFFMPEASGPCRFGQYNALQRLILSELGYEDVPIISPNQASDFYQTLKAYGRDFHRRAWYGMCAVDVLDKLACSTRPYEINKGEVDKIFRVCLDLICKKVEGKDNIVKVMPIIRDKFLDIPVRREPKPLIGITGEIYVRRHPFSNDNIVKRIEKLGGEVELAGTAEWFSYTNFKRKDDSIANKNYKELITYWLQGFWQNQALRKIEKGVHGYLNHLKEPTTKELFSHSNPYLHQTVEGEAVLTVGKCIDFMQKGIDGVITVMPFTCMPGTNTAGVMARVKEKYNVPYLNIAYDGIDQPTTQTRLEAFMHQSCQYKNSK